MTCWKAVSHGFAALQAINVLTDLTLTLMRLVTLLPRTRNVTLRVTFFLEKATNRLNLAEDARQTLR